MHLHTVSLYRLQPKEGTKWMIWAVVSEHQHKQLHTLSTLGTVHFCILFVLLEVAVLDTSTIYTNVNNIPHLCSMFRLKLGNRYDRSRGSTVVFIYSFYTRPENHKHIFIGRENMLYRNVYTQRTAGSVTLCFTKIKTIHFTCQTWFTV